MKAINKWIEIGNKKLIDLTQDNLIDIMLIEGVCFSLDFFSRPIVEGVNKTMFSNIILIDYHQLKINDNSHSKTICVYFNHEEFTYHWHYENDEKNSIMSKRLEIKSIKYLIDKGFDVPLY